LSSQSYYPQLISSILCSNSLAELSSWYIEFECPSFLTNLDYNPFVFRSCYQIHQRLPQTLWLLDSSRLLDHLYFCHHGIKSFCLILIFLKHVHWLLSLQYCSFHLQIGSMKELQLQFTDHWHLYLLIVSLKLFEITY